MRASMKRRLMFSPTPPIMPVLEPLNSTFSNDGALLFSLWATRNATPVNRRTGPMFTPQFERDLHAVGVYLYAAAGLSVADIREAVARAAVFELGLHVKHGYDCQTCHEGRFETGLGFPVRYGDPVEGEVRKRIVGDVCTDPYAYTEYLCRRADGRGRKQNDDDG